MAAVGKTDVAATGQPATLNVVIAPLLVLKSRPLLAPTLTMLFFRALALFKAIAPGRDRRAAAEAVAAPSVRMPVPAWVRFPPPLMRRRTSGCPSG